MAELHSLAQFVRDVRFEQLSENAQSNLKVRLLDSIATAIGALQGEPVKMLRRHTEFMGGNPISTLIGGGEHTAPDRAALYNGFLVRYLDFNDSYLAPKETCHPSDNIAALLAAGEEANASGKDFLLALGVAYQIQCRLSDEAPVRHHGFDHTVQGSYSAAAGAAKVMGLDERQIANAIGIAGTAYNALRVTRTGRLSHWKGLAFPSVAYTSTHAAYMARHGITGPEEVFEGNKGFKDTIAGDFEIDWSKEDLEKVNGTIIKKYNAEIHSQSTLEGVIELRNQYGINPENVQAIELNTFDVAYNIIGGGEEGEKKTITKKEEADHSLPYMIAAALLDGNVMPAQYQPARIQASDIQHLLQKVSVREKPELSKRFPDEMAVELTITLQDGTEYQIEKADYEGFHTRPAGWSAIQTKFHELAADDAPEELRHQIIDRVKNFEQHSVRELMQLLQQVGPQG